MQPASNDDYIGKIRKRLEEDAVARQEREKRRRKVLVDQLKAHDTNEVGDTPLQLELIIGKGDEGSVLSMGDNPLFD